MENSSFDAQLQLNEAAGTEQHIIVALDSLHSALYLGKVMVPPRLLGDRVGSEKGG